MKKLLFTLIVLSAIACKVQQPVSKADVSAVKTETLPVEGIFYYLPTTAIKVEITAQEEHLKPGPFYRYSQRYLNLADVITEEKEEWRITGARLSTEGRPDPQRLFRIQTQGTPAASSVALTPEGVLRGINLPAIDTMPGATPTNNTVEEQSPKSPFFDDVPYTEEQLMKTSTAAMAEETAKEIYRIRDAKRRLLEGDAQILPPDQGAYHTVLNELEAQEKKFLSLFVGKKIVRKVVQTFYFIPNTNTLGQQVLCRFSSQKGFVDPMDVSGTPVYIDVNTNSSVPDVTAPLPSDPDDEDRGLVYCIPAPAKVKIIDRTNLLTESFVNLGQFGTLHRIPDELLNSPNSSISIDASTGAILRIKGAK